MTTAVLSWLSDETTDRGARQAGPVPSSPSSAGMATDGYDEQDSEVERMAVHSAGPRADADWHRRQQRMRHQQRVETGNALEMRHDAHDR